VDADRILLEHGGRIATRVAGAEVVVTGSASVPGLEAADVDLVVLADDVGAAAAALRELYPVLYEEQWRDDWAAFRDLGPPHVDVVVTRRGSRGDAYHRLAWQLLRQDKHLQAEYRMLKGDPHDYEARKRAFFDRVVARLGDARG